MKVVASEIILVLFGTILPQLSLAHLSFFGFGSNPSKASSTDMVPEPASSNASPSFTSILFGTELNKPGTESSAAGAGKPANVGSGGGLATVADGAPPSSSVGGWISGLSDQQRPSVPTATSNNNYPKTQGQSDYFAASPLPQSNPAGMPVHNSHFPPNLAKDTSRVPPFHSTNAKPHLNAPPQNSLQFKTVEGQTKTGTFTWMSPQGQIYDVSYVADLRPEETKMPVRNGHYSYSALRPAN